VSAAILAVDLGTAAARVGLVGLDGRVLASERTPVPAPVGDGAGISEQDPEDWWGAIVGSAARLVATHAPGRAVTHARGPTATRAPDRAAPDIVAICAVGHGPTCVPTAPDGHPTGPAITWRDRRASATSPEARDLADATGVDGWGLGILPAALWLERHEPAAAGRTAHYLATWEWLGHRLTGRALATYLEGATVADPSRAAAAGLDSRKIPPATRPGVNLGPLTAEAAAAFGTRSGTPVISGTFDAAASILGAGLREPGEAIDVGGASGGFAVMTDDPAGVPDLRAVASPLPGRWLLGGAMAATGSALEWLRRDVFGGALTLEALIAEAAETPPGADGLVFLPYLAGERAPIHDPNARGALVGLTLAHRRGHVTRAVLEAAAYAIRHVAAPIAAAGVPVTELRVTGGPAHSDIWNQVKADVIGVPVAVPAVLETGVLGAAILGAAGVGVHPDLASAIGAMVRIELWLAPRPEFRAVYDEGFAIYSALYPRLRPLFDRR
jgi:xylulokinase